MLFRDRVDAGIALANKISSISFNKKKTVIMAIPNGGVIVASEIAREMQIPLDVVFVKTIEVPFLPQLILGVVSEEGEVFYNEDLIERLGYNVSQLKKFEEKAIKELNKNKSILRREFSGAQIAGKDVVLISDCISSELAIIMLVKQLRKRRVRKITIATPLCSLDAFNYLKRENDKIEVIILHVMLDSVGEYYKDFGNIKTEEVIDVLSELNSSQVEKTSVSSILT